MLSFPESRRHIGGHLSPVEKLIFGRFVRISGFRPRENLQIVPDNGGRSRLCVSDASRVVFLRKTKVRHFGRISQIDVSPARTLRPFARKLLRVRSPKGHIFLYFREIIFVL